MNLKRILSSILSAFMICSLIMGATNKTVKLPSSTDDDPSLDVEITGRGNTDSPNGVRWSSYGTVPVTLVRDNTEERFVMKGTTLRSLNNMYADSCYYHPPYDTVDFIERILKRDYHFGAVYTDQFDIDETTSSDGKNYNWGGVTDADKMSRETNILGTDLLVIQDDWSESAGGPNTNEVHLDSKGNYNGNISSLDSTIPNYLAVMACYKALSQSKYTLYFRNDPKANSNINLPVSKTVFVGEIGAAEVYVYGPTLTTDVYVSRTVPTKYWEAAKKSAIVSSEFGSNEAMKPITIGDFALMLQKFLYLNGEPVITDKEQYQLLVTYGYSIPNYLPSTQIDAIKYCMARGIFDGTEQFGDNITGQQMLTYLMRAKDKNSRLTFKDINIDYDASLVDKGFGIVDVIDSQAIDNIKIEDNKEKIDYFDYLVKVNDSNRLVDNRGNEVTSLQLSSNAHTFGAESSAVEGFSYLGKDKGYYHFKIPASIGSKSGATRTINGKQYIAITSPSDEVTPGGFLLEYGGGVYNSDLGKNVGNVYVMNRAGFSSSSNISYVDKDRKVNQQQVVDVSKLEGEEVKITGTIPDPENTKWFGYAITDENKDKLKEKKFEYDSSTGTATITVSKDLNKNSDTVYKYILNHLTLSGEKRTKYPAYMYTGDTDVLMVSQSFLKDKAGKCEVTKMDESGEKYLVSFSNQSVIIDTKNRRAISSQWIKEFDKIDIDKSPLISMTDSETFIDYRCVISIAGAYLMITESDDKKTKSISNMNGSDSDINKQLLFEEKSILPLQGYALGDKIQVNSNYEIPLAGMYGRANFILYEMNHDNSKHDFLLVFRPKDMTGKTGATSEATKKALQENFGVQLGEDEECNIYLLGDKSSDETLYGSVNANTAYMDDKGVTWLYKIPEAESFSMSDYTHQKNDNINPLPIVKKGSTLINFNANISTEYGYTKIPSSTISSLVSETLGLNHEDMIFGDGGSGYTHAQTEGSEVNLNSYILAPVAINSNAFTEGTYSLDDIKKANDGGISVGAMCFKVPTSKVVSIDESTKNTLEFSTCKFEVPSDNDIFKKVQYGIEASSSEYIYDNPNGSKLVGFSEYDGSNGFNISLGQGYKNLLDWGFINFIKQLSSIKDVLIALIYFCTYIVPIIMIYDFLAFAALMYVRNVGFIQSFCIRFVDIYKVLSLGKKDIDHIERKSLWVSTSVATVILIIISRGYLDAILLKLQETILGFMGL